MRPNVTPLDRAPTQRQLQVLDLLISHLLRFHTHARVRDIRTALDLKSTNAVRDHLLALERRGYIEPVGTDGARSYRILRRRNGEPFRLLEDGVDVVLVPMHPLRWAS